jgi:hypothetical protein
MCYAAFSNTQVQFGNFLDAEQSIPRALTILETEYGADAPTVGSDLLIWVKSS